jgi:hypothetical protein
LDEGEVEADDEEPVFDDEGLVTSIPDGYFDFD